MKQLVKHFFKIMGQQVKICVCASYLTVMVTLARDVTSLSHTHMHVLSLGLNEMKRTREGGFSAVG